MQCPRCKPVNMQTMKMGSVVIDECAQCGGIWFDQGELDQVIGSADPDLRWLDIDFWKDNSDFKVSTDELSCPKCSRYYLTRLKDEATNTTACLCSNCQGIWLDADQLHRIVQAVTEIANRMDSAEYLKESLHQVADMISAACSSVRGKSRFPVPLARPQCGPADVEIPDIQRTSQAGWHDRRGEKIASPLIYTCSIPSESGIAPISLNLQKAYVGSGLGWIFTFSGQTAKEEAANHLTTYF
jgi:Zn-finger nucleic acid-binding protein